jgi:hypothetical protein
MSYRVRGLVVVSIGDITVSSWGCDTEEAEASGFQIDSRHFQYLSEELQVPPVSKGNSNYLCVRLGARNRTQSS